MEVGPTTHYIMGGIRVDADTQESTIPGLFAAGECAAGHQRRQSPRRQLAVGPDRLRQARRRVRGAVRAQERRRADGRRRRRSSARCRRRWRRSSAAAPARTRTRCSTICRTRCRAWSASSAPRARCRRRSTQLDALQRARRARRRRRPSRIQRRLAHLHSICGTCSTCPRRSRARRSSARKAAAATSARTIPDKEAEFAHVQHRRRSATPDGSMQVVARAAAADAGGAEAGHRGAETVMAQATFQNLAKRARRAPGAFKDYTHRGLRGHGRARRRAPDPGRAGARPGVPLELQGGQVRLVLGGDQRQAAADVHDAGSNTLALDEPVTVEPMRAFPLIKDLVTDVSWNFRGQEAASRSSSRARPTRPTAPGGWRSATSIACRSSASASSASCARTSATCCAITTSTRSSSARASSSTPRRSRCTRSTPAIGCRDLKDKHGIGYCNITKCCTKVCPEHIHITDNAIIPLKERVVDRFYDPVTRLLRMITGMTSRAYR